MKMSFYVAQKRGIVFLKLGNWFKIVFNKKKLVFNIVKMTMKFFRHFSFEKIAI